MAKNKLYWRPQRVALGALLVISLVAITAVVAAESLKQRDVPYHDQMLAASRLARDCFDALKEERISRGIPIDQEIDPTQSGLVGLSSSEVTSVGGHLQAKQASVNPNWAAVVVRMLKEAGVKEGDTVAAGFSGSFPALNTSVCAAFETLHLKPVIISSAAASQFGANMPDFVWLDMEHTLHEEGLISFHSVAASVGGAEDVGSGMSEEGIALLKKKIEEYELDFIEPETFEASVAERIAIYSSQAGQADITAYVNVGGGTASVGTSATKREFDPGLNLTVSPAALRIDSVMGSFIKQDVPVIHMSHVETLAKRYNMPFPPPRPPQVGQGGVYAQPRYNRWIAGIGLAVTLLVTFLFVRTGEAWVMFKGKSHDDDHRLEPMI